MRLSGGERGKSIIYVFISIYHLSDKSELPFVPRLIMPEDMKTVKVFLRISYSSSVKPDNRQLHETEIFVVAHVFRQALSRARKIG